MTFGSLFSGIGGLDLGLERAGMECKWQVEIDPFCQRVLEKHWPNVRRYGDITKLDGSELESVDLIAAGIPCQPSSIAGEQRGEEDERWMWPDTLRILRALRSPLFLLENPTGLLVLGIRRILADLATSGYNSEWNCVPAAIFGAEQLRERLFVLAHSGSAGLEGHECGILADRHAVSGHASRCDSGFSRIAPRKNGASRSWILRDIHGVPNRVDRVRSLGNSVVPQVSEWIGRRIVEATHGEK